jgi:DNA-binding PadR family transcriptional regulator
MTIQTQAVLQALLRAQDNELYGLDLIRETGVPAGTVYPLMKRLEEAGWITTRWAQGDKGHNRKFFQVPGARVQEVVAALQRASGRNPRLQNLLGGLTSKPGLEQP